MDCLHHSKVHRDDPQGQASMSWSPRRGAYHVPRHHRRDRLTLPPCQALRKHQGPLRNHPQLALQAGNPGCLPCPCPQGWSTGPALCPQSRQPYLVSEEGSVPPQPVGHRCTCDLLRLPSRISIPKVKPVESTATSRVKRPGSAVSPGQWSLSKAFLAQPGPGTGIPLWTENTGPL